MRLKLAYISGNIGRMVKDSRYIYMIDDRNTLNNVGKESKGTRIVQRTWRRVTQPDEPHHNRRRIARIRTKLT